MNVVIKALLLTFLVTTTTLYGQGKKWFIPLDEDYYLNNDKNINVLPGDTLVLQGGNRWKHLQIKGMQGTPTKPIVIINEPYKTVTFKKAITNTGGVLSITHCSNIIITGSGNDVGNDKNHPDYYGIRMIVDSCGVFLGLTDGTTAATLEQVYIEGAKGPNYTTTSQAIMAKSEPICRDGILENYYGEFTLENLVIRNCYIKNVGGEGIYAGSTKANKDSIAVGGTTGCLQKYLYTQVPVIKNGKVVGVTTQIDTINRMVKKAVPHMLKNVQIYDNVFDGTGWDAIQVNWTCGVTIRNNTITNYGFLDNNDQKNGINLGSSSDGKIYNNYINEGKGFGISAKPDGDIDIVNNVVINAGVGSKVETNSHSSIIFYGTGYQNDSLYYKCADFNLVKKTNIYNNLVIYTKQRYGKRKDSNDNEIIGIVGHGIRLEGLTKKDGTFNPFEINMGNNIVVGSFDETIYHKSYNFNAPNKNEPASANEVGSTYYYYYPFNNNGAFGINRNKDDTTTVYHTVNKKYKTIDELRLASTSTPDPRYWDYTPTASSPFLGKGINFAKVVEVPDYYGKRRIVAKKGLVNTHSDVVYLNQTVLLPANIDMGPVELYSLVPNSQDTLLADTVNTWGIYPNPANTRLYLTGDVSKVQKITVYNVLGSAIKEEYDAVHDVDISDLAVGYYQVQLQLHSGKVHSFKLMKNK